MNFMQANQIAMRLGLRFRELSNGYQFYIGKHKVTAYQKKVQDNLNNKWHDYVPGNELPVIAKIFDVPVNGGFNALKDAADDAGVMACIKHVEKKLDFYIDRHPVKMDNETCLMLKNLITEFEQYLHNPLPPVMHPNVPAAIRPLAKLGTLVALKTSFLGQPVGSKAIAYNAYVNDGVFLITESGVELGAFTHEEVIEHLEFLKHTNLNYQFKNMMQLHQDFASQIFKTFFN